MMEYDEEVCKDHPVDLHDIIDKNYEKNIINEKYDYIEAIIEECLFNKAEKSAFTDKVDQIMTCLLYTSGSISLSFKKLWSLLSRSN